MKMTWKSVCFNLLFFPVVFGADLDYLAPLLRSQTTNCLTVFHEAYCHMKCGDRNALCVKDNCSCLSTAIAKELTNRNDNKYEMDEDIVDVNSEEADRSRLDSQLIYALRPTVRHHIAHFCPNLDIARECIRKCMALGKPAFCGKDHVCYCGHKYSNKDINSNIDIKAMYAQFNDLYTKYFGADHSVEE